jgi:hypothetical protein
MVETGLPLILVGGVALQHAIAGDDAAFANRNIHPVAFLVIAWF